MRSDTANPVSKVLGLLKRRNVAFAIGAVTLAMLAAGHVFWGSLELGHSRVLLDLAVEGYCGRA
jgi:hypothetical protein